MNANPEQVRSEQPEPQFVMTDFSGQKLIVVGGSSGMGRETAAEIVAAGGSAVIIGLEPEKVDNTVQTLAKDDHRQYVGSPGHRGNSMFGLLAGQRRLARSDPQPGHRVGPLPDPSQHRCPGHGSHADFWTLCAVGQD